MQDPNLKPFVTKPSGPVFIALNILRVLSIISLLLVFAANVVTMANDIKAIKSSSSTSTSSSTAHNSSTAVWDCDYYEYSTVPDQTGGSFWSILNRLFIIFECILLTLSEVGFPKRLFEEFIPVLGPAHGLGGLGVFEALIGAQVLSHYCDRFPQVTSWLLFIVGCLNIVAGVAFRSAAKGKRLIFSWENVSTLTPQTRAAASAWDMITEKSSPPSNRKYPHRTPYHSSSTTSFNSTNKPTNQYPTTHQPQTRTQRDENNTENLQDIPLSLSRSSTTQSISPLLPSRSEPGGRFGGFGFGRQGEKRAEEGGWKISRPVESLPRYAF